MLCSSFKFVLFIFFSSNILFVSSENKGLNPKIVNGITVENIIPYQVSLRVSIRDRVKFGRGHTCGAVLISDKVVLTAAHCLYDGNQPRSMFDLRVVLASLNRFHYTSDTVIRTLRKIVVHPGYRRGHGLQNDIGILFVRLYNLSKNIKLVNYQYNF
jgi:trypsin